MPETAIVNREVGKALIPSVLCPNCGSSFEVPSPTELGAFQHISHEKQRAFLSAYVRNGGRMSTACKELGIDRTNPYYWLKTSSEFADAFEVAKELSILELEAEAIRRGFEGVDKPITYKGEITDTYKDFSDTLLIFTLKGLKPDKYRERFEHTGANGGPIEIQAGIDFAQVPGKLVELVLDIANGKIDPKLIDESKVPLLMIGSREVKDVTPTANDSDRSSEQVIDVLPQPKVAPLPFREEW